MDREKIYSKFGGYYIADEITLRQYNVVIAIK